MPLKPEPNRAPSPFEAPLSAMPPGARLWIERGARLAATAAYPAVVALASVGRNKWVATHLDVSGIGVLAQIVQGQTWLGIAAGLGMSLPVAQAVSESLGRGDVEGARRGFWTAFGLVLAAVLVIATAALLLAPALSRALLDSPSHADLVRWSVLGLVGYAIANLLLGLFAGRSDVTAPVIYAAFGGAASLTATFLLVPRAGLVGATIGVTVFWPAGALGVLLVRGRAYRDVPGPPTRPIVSGEVAKRLLGIGTSALFLALLDLGTMLALRAHYVRAHGVDANGLLQAALALSQIVGAVFYAYLASYAFGKISAASAAGGVDAARTYTRRQWKPLLLLAAAAIAFTMVAASPLLHLLYSTRFDAARPLMAWALLGEFGRIAALTWSVGALPVGGRRLWVGIGTVWPIALAVAYAAFVRAGAGAMSLPFAYAAGGGVLLLVAIWRMRRAGIGPRAGDLAAAGAAAALLTGLAALITRA
ncbi:MAG TPA: MATE family efflux transporter [Candidatus Eisenbacteria bacterium]|nr:MATE family efflux transporter [Candidatus Eisenbacteria bacterium]